MRVHSRMPKPCPVKAGHIKGLAEAVVNPLAGDLPAALPMSFAKKIHFAVPSLKSIWAKRDCPVLGMRQLRSACL